MTQIFPTIRSTWQRWFSNTASDNHSIQLLSLAIFTILVRVPYFFWPMISDEGGYAYTADWWFKGLTLYSPDLWFDRPQGIFLVYKLGMLIFGGSTVAIRLWGAIWTAGITVMIYLIAMRLFDQKIAWFSGLLYTLVSTMPQIEGFTANAEVFATAAGVVSLWLMLRKNWFWAGVFSASAFLLKPSGGTIGMVALYLLISQKQMLITWLKYGAGTVIIIAIAFIHGSLTVGICEYLFAVFQFRMNTLSPQPGMELLESIKLTGLVWIPIALVSIPAIIRIKDSGIRILLAWFVTAVAGMSISSYWNLHYYIQLIPPLAILATVGIARIAGKVPRVARVVRAAILIPALLMVLVSLVTPSLSGSWNLYHRPGYLVSDQVAEYIRQNSQPDDRIYVAWTEADIYQHAGRRSISSSIFRNFLVKRPGQYQQVVESIQKSEPKFVLLLDAPITELDPGGEFHQSLGENYRVVKEFNGIPLYGRKE